jgi:hypothetical protein
VPGRAADRVLSACPASDPILQHRLIIDLAIFVVWKSDLTGESASFIRPSRHPAAARGAATLRARSSDSLLGVVPLDRPRPPGPSVGRPPGVSYRLRPEAAMRKSMFDRRGPVGHSVLSLPACAWENEFGNSGAGQADRTRPAVRDAQIACPAACPSAVAAIMLRGAAESPISRTSMPAARSGSSSAISGARGVA